MVKRKLEIDVENIFSQLSRRLARPRDDYFVGQEENLSFLLDLVTRTVDKGEGNSIIVLGPHGVGKTALGKWIWFFFYKFVKLSKTCSATLEYTDKIP